MCRYLSSSEVESMHCPGHRVMEDIDHLRPGPPEGKGRTIMDDKVSLRLPHLGHAKLEPGLYFER